MLASPVRWWIRLAFLVLAFAALAACASLSEAPPGDGDHVATVPEQPMPGASPPLADTPAAEDPGGPDDPVEPAPDPEPEPDPRPDPIAPPGPEPEPDPEPEPPVVGDAERMLQLVNQARASARSCGSHGSFAATHPLALESRLSSAAQWYSDDMHHNGAWGHIGSDGSTLVQRVERTGYPWLALGENIAKGYTSPESVMAAWLGSPGHCANIMRPQFTELGFGRTGVSWTQVLGDR